jgi:TonB family protein
MTGVVRLQFIIDSTGRVAPSSIRLLGTAHPMLATAARDALLLARYKPAERSRRPVPQVAMQEFEFKP